MFEKVKQLIEVFGDLEVIEEDGKLIIQEKSVYLPDLENFIKIYEPEKNITKVGNVYEIQTSIMSANKFRALLMSVFPEYKYDVVDAYKLKIGIQVNENIKADKKDMKEFTIDEIAKKVDEKYPEAKVIIKENEIEVKTDKVEEVAKFIDENFSEKTIELFDDKLLIK